MVRIYMLQWMDTAPNNSLISKEYKYGCSPEYALQFDTIELAEKGIEDVYANSPIYNHIAIVPVYIRTT